MHNQHISLCWIIVISPGAYVYRLNTQHYDYLHIYSLSFSLFIPRYYHVVMMSVHIIIICVVIIVKELSMLMLAFHHPH